MKRKLPAKTMLTTKEIGANLRTWRKLRHLTLQQMADKIGVSSVTLSNLENGDPSVAFHTVVGACSILGITDRLIAATDPYETDFGRARADQELPQRVRR